MKKQSLWAKIDPNHVTLARIFTTFILAGILLADNFVSTLIAMPLFTLIAVSDKLDGYLARKYNKITELGKMLDRVADKFFILSCLVILTINLANIDYPGWGCYASGTVVIIIIELVLLYTAIAGHIKNSNSIKKTTEVAAGTAGKAKMGFEIGVTAAPLLSLFLFQTGSELAREIGQLLMSLTYLSLICVVYFGYLSIKDHLEK